MFEAHLADPVHGEATAQADTAEAAVELAFRELAESWMHPNDLAKWKLEPHDLFDGTIRDNGEVWWNNHVDALIGTVREIVKPSSEPSSEIGPEELVHVIITQRPNKVWVVFRDKIHYGRWSTGNPGSNNIREAIGNASLINAAMYAWDGQQEFTTTYGELLKRSGGWGISW